MERDEKNWHDLVKIIALKEGESITIYGAADYWMTVKKIKEGGLDTKP